MDFDDSLAHGIVWTIPNDPLQPLPFGTWLQRVTTFLHVFRTRLRKYFICLYAQKAHFLQRRKSAILCVDEDSHQEHNTL